MNSEAVLEILGYKRSPNYIDLVEPKKELSFQFSHVYRRAVKDCGLQGVYILKSDEEDVDVPVVFYCKAADETQANLYHKRVWNQDVAPFVLVETPATLRLYSGFRYATNTMNNRSRGILEAAIAFNQVAERLNAFSAESIDSGKVWDVWGHEITPRTRVDRKLLDNLKKLDGKLRDQGLSRQVSHSLIGKFVYLRYLKDRDILSERKFKKWGVKPEELFTRRADLEKFYEVNLHLDNWLNGSVFPLEPDAIELEHLQLVAGVFSGDDPQDQLHLDFEPYDFSFIPIETLSVIYEQFLHSPDKGETNRGRKAGAYYTPLPLVNFVLKEMDKKRPLKEGMRVLDPSCGSGAFLVQCYRALIERRRLASGKLRPTELRELLIKHIYGVDSDGDACQVAELSLILTLLDYVEPPDLENSPRFKLPILRGRNIFQADFFDPDSDWFHKSSNLSFDWLVGNPPWVEFNQSNDEDRHVRNWADSNKEKYHIGGKQIAEAFVWQSLLLLEEGAVAGLILPAMTLFKKKSKNFRENLFQTVKAWCVANFSNLRFSLFSGRSTRPAMALFFNIIDKEKATLENSDRIITFAPFVISQIANRRTREGAKKGTWNIVVNGSEISDISFEDAVSGKSEPWKLAMWGSFRDQKLFRRIALRFPPLTEFIESHGLKGPHEGFQLRDPEKPNESLDPMPELEGKNIINFKMLENCGRIFDFPSEAISIILENRAYVRKGRGKLPMMVSQPPHTIIDAVRRFAIYSDQFLAFPGRQIGISGPKLKKDVLKALSVYLSSDFVKYQQFIASPEWGISSPRATLQDLNSLPVPIDELSDTELITWANLLDELVNEGVGGKAVPHNLIDEMNKRVYRLLGLSESEKILIEDFVRVNMKMIDGMAPASLIKAPDNQTINSYLMMLKAELDSFLGDHSDFGHMIDVLQDDTSAIIAITLSSDKKIVPRIFQANDEASAALTETRDKLIEEHSQWLYFNRNLRVYMNNTLYMLKPMEFIHWTKRQAVLDAGEVIAETLGQ